MAFLRRQGEWVHAPRPDLILLDLNMPLMDGREVLEQIVQDPKLRNIPIIVLTTCLYCLPAKVSMNRMASSISATIPPSKSLRSRTCTLSVPLARRQVT